MTTTMMGLVLGGGQSRRMGMRQGVAIHKTDVQLAGQPLLQRVIQRLDPQVDQVLLNLNRPTAMDVSGFVQIADMVAGYPGPLTGLVSAFEYLEHMGHRDYTLLLVPCDGPFLPRNLASRLAEARQAADADAVCAAWQGEWQPTFSLWHSRTAGRAKTMLLDEQRGGFKGLLRELHTEVVDWPAASEEHAPPFFNINTPDDLARAEHMLLSAQPSRRSSLGDSL